jgi:hypothetical protein
MQQQRARKSAAAVDPSDQEGTAGVQAHVLNPKAVTLAELYGSFNTVTNEWTDGLASRMIRAAVADSRDTMHWVVFDGPVDAGWVESMNTGVHPQMMLVFYVQQVAGGLECPCCSELLRHMLCASTDGGQGTSRRVER